MIALNKWISENVMGDKVCWHKYKMIPGEGYMRDMLCELCNSKMAVSPDVVCSEGWLEHLNAHDIPSYTTDPKLAFDAAKKADLYMGENIRISIENNDEYCISFDYEWYNGSYLHNVFHENLATALCLAIYKKVTDKNWEER